MKTLKCEMCGSVDLVKQDGLFVCQYCGTKYSVEEAKKMMIEGTVEVQGTVTVDNSAAVEKYLINARRAKSKEDWEETEKYYNLVKQNEPTNLEAIFYSAYGRARVALVERDLYKREAAFKVLKNCVSMLDDTFEIEKAEESKKKCQEISDDIFDMVNASYAYNLSADGLFSDKNETVELFSSLQIAFCDTLNKIVEKYPSGIKEDTVFYYRLMFLHYEYVLRKGRIEDRASIVQKMSEVHRQWNIVDNSHQIPKKRVGARCSGLGVLSILSLIFSFSFLGAILGAIVLSRSKENSKYRKRGVVAVSIFSGLLLAILVVAVILAFNP